MEWKKITSMQYGKIVFHSILYQALALLEKAFQITLHSDALFYGFKSFFTSSWVCNKDKNESLSNKHWYLVFFLLNPKQNPRTIWKIINLFRDLYAQRRLPFWKKNQRSVLECKFSCNNCIYLSLLYDFSNLKSIFLTLHALFYIFKCVFFFFFDRG